MIDVRSHSTSPPTKTLCRFYKSKMHNAIEVLPADIDLAVSQPWAYLMYVVGTTPAEGGGGGARQHLLAWLMDAAILEAIELIFGLACIFLFCLLSGLLCGVHNNHGAGEGPQGLWDKDNQEDNREERNDNKSNKSPCLSSSLLSTLEQCMKYHIMFLYFK